MCKLLGDEHADVLRETLAGCRRRADGGGGRAADRAGLHEKTPERTTHRNGYRERSWQTRAGEVTQAPAVSRACGRAATSPASSNRAPAPEKALVAVVQEAYVNGVSTRKVERLVTQLGLAGMSRSAVSRLCAGLDQQVRFFRERPLEGRYPYLWLDAKVEKVREPGGVRSKALVIAQGVHEDGRREIIGIDVGEAETEAFWREFLRSLRARGLAGVQLCVSDAHEGLKAAIAKVLGCPWQRCTVHFLRDMRWATAARRSSRSSRAPSARSSPPRARARRVSAWPASSPPSGADDSQGGPPAGRGRGRARANMAFPREHWCKLRSTNPLERVNREIGRRSDVVGIYPNDAALIRLAGALLIEQNDEWLVNRRYLSEESMQASAPPSRLKPRALWRRAHCRRPKAETIPTSDLHHYSGLRQTRRGDGQARQQVRACVGDPSCLVLDPRPVGDHLSLRMSISRSARAPNSPTPLGQRPRSISSSARTATATTGSSSGCRSQDLRGGRSTRSCRPAVPLCVPCAVPPFAGTCGPCAEVHGSDRLHPEMADRRSRTRL